MHLAIDFDGTLALYDGWRDKHVFGMPIRGMRDFVRKMIRKGWQYSVFTARDWDEWGSIAKWLEFHRFPPPVGVTNLKRMEFTWILDDRAIAFGGQVTIEVDGLPWRKAWWKDGGVKWRRSPYAKKQRSARA